MHSRSFLARLPRVNQIVFLIGVAEIVARTLAIGLIQEIRLNLRTNLQHAIHSMHCG